MTKHNKHGYHHNRSHRCVMYSGGSHSAQADAMERRAIVSAPLLPANWVIPTVAIIGVALVFGKFVFG